jgi:hypothetical protein
MTDIDKLVDRRISEYESRLKHIDELYEQAHQATAKLDDDHALKTELGEYHEQRTDLANHTAKLKELPLAHWREDMIQSSGPMAIWDVLAQKLEDLIERVDK